MPKGENVVLLLPPPPPVLVSPYACGLARGNAVGPASDAEKEPVGGGEIKRGGGGDVV